MDSIESSSRDEARKRPRSRSRSRSRSPPRSRRRTESSSSDSDTDRHMRHRSHKKEKKHKKKKKKKHRKKQAKEGSGTASVPPVPSDVFGPPLPSGKRPVAATPTPATTEQPSCARRVPPATRAFVPMSEAEYKLRQQQVREVYDEDTGRMLLIRGDGERIERIVSRDQQAATNRTATAGDGASFQRAAVSSSRS